MPVGPILLTLLVVLTVTGFLDGFLPRFGLSTRQFVLVGAAMLATSPMEVGLAPGLSVNVGSGLLLMALSVWLVSHRGNVEGMLRALTATGVTTVAVYAVGRWFPPGIPTELNLFYLDALYLHAMVAGVTAYASAIGGRTAFTAAVFGLMLGHLAMYLWPKAPVTAAGAGPGTAISLGGGGFQGAALVAGVLALGLAHLLNERAQAPETSEGMAHPRS